MSSIYRTSSYEPPFVGVLFTVPEPVIAMIGVGVFFSCSTHGWATSLSLTLLFTTSSHSPLYYTFAVCNVHALTLLVACDSHCV